MKKKKRIRIIKNIFNILILLAFAVMGMSAKNEGCCEKIYHKIFGPQEPQIGFEIIGEYSFGEKVIFKAVYICPSRYYKENESPILKGYIDDVSMFEPKHLSATPENSTGEAIEPILTEYTSYVVHSAEGKIELHFKDYGSKRQEWEETYSTKDLQWTGEAPVLYLIKWTGDKQKGRPNEIIQPPSAYPISVRVIKDDGTGLNDVSVTFTTAEGYGTFFENNSNEYTTSTSRLHYLNGIAYARLILSENIGFNNVTVNADGCGEDVVFEITCGMDEELSHLA